MKTAAWAWIGLLHCCAAISASNGFDPGASASAVEAVKQSQAGVVPACVVDRADALVDGRVHIRPGETVCIRVRLNDDRPELVALVDAADAADALVITASLSQGRTFLTLKNPLSQWLRYRAYMRVGGQLSYTSSCPVMSNHRLAFEDWPYAIDEFTLGSFEIAPDPEATANAQVPCR